MTRTAPLRRSTKDRIVDAAIALFNESGVHAVTTNHVAERAGMSPGNLYYHYANKEEIIRDAFERMNAEADAIWGPPSPAAPGERASADVSAFHRVMARNLDLFVRYTFFVRELPSLLRADPKLRARYADIAARRTAQIDELLRPFIAAGLLRDLDDAEDRRALVETAWMIALFCVPYAETLDPAAPPRSGKAMTERLYQAVERGALLVLQLLRPHLDPMAYAALVVVVRSELAAAIDSADT